MLSSLFQIFSTRERRKKERKKGWRERRKRGWEYREKERERERGWGEERERKCPITLCSHFFLLDPSNISFLLFLSNLLFSSSQYFSLSLSFSSFSPLSSFAQYYFNSSLFLVPFQIRYKCQTIYIWEEREKRMNDLLSFRRKREREREKEKN